MKTFLFLGGSNVRGYGTPDNHTYSNINNIFTWKSDNSGWLQSPSEPIYDPTIDAYSAFRETDVSKQGASFQLQFCNDLIDAGVPDCGIVIAARSKTRIEDWSQKYRVGSTESLYSCAIDRVSKVREAGNTIDGVVILQGGQDADGYDADGNLVGPGYWTTNFEAMLRNLRVDIGNLDAPIVIIQLAENVHNRPKWDKIKERQGQMTAGYKMGVVNIEGCEKYQQDPNESHYSPYGYRQFGTKAATVMMNLL